MVAAAASGHNVEASLIAGDRVVVAGRLRVHPTSTPAAVRSVVDAALESPERECMIPNYRESLPSRAQGEGPR